MEKKQPHPHAPGSRKARREAAAARAIADQVQRQAALIALRASMGLEYVVAVRFAAGAHDVRIAKVGEMPKGYTEARMSIRERRALPALRYRDAERVADTLRASLARTAPVQRIARRRA